jgi:GNAT superfamily N-acetyltransferase
MTVTSLAPRGELHSLPDGSTIVLRPLGRDDDALLLDIFDQLGPTSREFRFLAPKFTLTSADLRQLLAVDDHDHVAVVALSATDGRPIGGARVGRLEDDAVTADVAVTVVDAWQRQGVGTVLATVLGERARAVGITRFTALMMQDNEAALGLLHRTTTDVERVGMDGHTAEFLVSLAPPTPARRRARALLKGAQAC